MRYATACKCGLCSSNCSTCQSRALMSHPSVGIRHSSDERAAADVTAAATHRTREASMLMTKDRPAIDVRGLTKTYDGGVEAVKAIDFEVSVGEVFGLLGPNGAGKSTTIGMLTTTPGPTSGTALLGGFDVAVDPREARRISSVVFQDAVVDRS